MVWPRVNRIGQLLIMTLVVPLFGLGVYRYY